MKNLFNINTRLYQVSTNTPTGFGMVEVLIALLILSIGLLGVASLQYVSLFSNKDAQMRTQAVFIVQQMTERLRASAVLSPVYNGSMVSNTYFNEDIYNFKNLSCTSKSTPYNCHCSAFPSAIVNCHTGNCSAEQIAIFDAYQLTCALARENPSAQLNLSCNDANSNDSTECSVGSILAVMVTWPNRSWRQQFKKINPDCNVEGAFKYDCVRVEITL